MLENAWESHATTLANAPNASAFIEAVENFVRVAKIDLNKPSRVVYARDTRPSGASLVRALEDGFKAIGAETRDAGITTTPVLHYLVRAINTKGTKDEYGPDTEEGYVTKLTTAFKKLIVGQSTHPRMILRSLFCRPAKLPCLPWLWIAQMVLVHWRYKNSYLLSVLALPSSP
jgi:phosphoacetylglucosamine mutase